MKQAGGLAAPSVPIRAAPFPALEPPPQGPQPRRRHRLQVLPVEAQFPLAGLQPQQGQPQGRLAGAGLADDADDAPGAHREAHLLHGAHVAGGAAQEAGADREVDAHAARFHEGRALRLAGGFAGRRLAGSSRRV